MEDRMPIESGGYTLNIRCDGGHDPHQPSLSNEELDREIVAGRTWSYFGETHNQCKAIARREGWLFKRGGKTLCPYCTGKKS